MSHEIVVTVKAGVSRTTMGCHDGSGRITGLFVRKTPRSKLNMVDDTEWKNFFSIPQKWGSRSSIVLISVIPQLSEWLKEMFSGSSRVTLFCPSGKELGLKIEYFPENSLGIDRIAACRGTLIRYPDLSSRSFVVADFGSHTVLTLCRKGTVIGGSIASGVPLMLQSIGGGVVLEKYSMNSLNLPRRAVGRSTSESIATGTILGAVRGVEGLFQDMCRELGDELELILTGGLSRLFRPFFRIPVRCDRQLIHYGAWAVGISGPSERERGILKV